MRRLTLALLLLVAAVAAGAGWVRAYLATPLSVPEAGYRLDIAPGSSWSTVVRKLASADVVTAGFVLTVYGRLTGQAARIQAGEYQIRPGTTPGQLLDDLVAGRVLLHKITLVEGWSVREILAALRADAAVARTVRASSATELAGELGLPWKSAEGAFLPETYAFPRGTSDRDLLMQAHEALKLQLERAWRDRLPALPLATPYELLVLASIVEKETALPTERPLIAGVFARRLDQGMRLQTDPTVIYGLGAAFDGNLTRRHLETDTPWNTYTRSGLPPTPIAAPSADALAASARPAGGRALYFVASGTGDGSHRFSNNLREHEAAVREYLAASRRHRN